MLVNGDEDDALRMRWALVCSIRDRDMLNTLSDFSSWFLSEVTKVANKMNIYARFEERAKVVFHVPVGDFGACVSAYESIRKNWPCVMLVVHILPEKGALEHEWMCTLCQVHGFIRQGVLLQNALDRFARICKNGYDFNSICRNVAQWISRATNSVCLAKDPAMKPYDLRVGSSSTLATHVKTDQDAIRTAVHAVLSGSQDIPLLHGGESPVRVWGFPSSLNEFGVAQLFHGLKVTGVHLRIGSAVVIFATKFLAFQACALDGKVLDRLHTLRVEPLVAEVRKQVARAELRK